MILQYYSFILSDFELCFDLFIPEDFFYYLSAYYFLDFKD